jgi:hypothetical protein
LSASASVAAPHATRLAAALWVDDKRAAVLRYLEEKKLGRKKAAQSGELKIARSAKEAAWVAMDVAKEAQRTAKLALTIAGASAAAAAERSRGQTCVAPQFNRPKGTNPT